MTGEEETSHELSIGLQPWVDEVVRIKNALATGDGDKEDIITYAKEIRALRSKLDRATEALELVESGDIDVSGTAIIFVKGAMEVFEVVRAALSFIKGEG